jgi:integrative and conjugative element protein (TIGR02256 family)
VTAARAWLSETALGVVLDEAEQRTPLETGGVLLGYRHDEEFVITAALGSGPGARHEHDGFWPDGAWHECEVAAHYARSGRVETYLGDWHSHPHGAPLPSKRDRKTARRIARHRDARAPQPLMLIAGRGQPDDWVALMYRYAARRLRPLMVQGYGARPAG